MLPALAALLVFVAAAVGTALALMLPSHGGLNPGIAAVSLVVGALAGTGAWWHVRRQEGLTLPIRRRISPWAWTTFVVFTLFALRSFCWLVYQDDKQLSIGSPNNLGDISMHLQEVRDFADGARWWPAHPEAANETLRYYPGVNLFHALLTSVGADTMHVFVWLGLIGSAAAMLALFRWGGSFTVAGFLFGGGLAGFEVFAHGLHDYQETLGWKSLPLAIFVTQRPFLYALPAGLLLMIHWRRKFFTDLPPVERQPGSSVPLPPPVPGPGLLPFWVETLLYATLPIFHLFAFVFLSALLGWWFLAYFGRTAMRWHLVRLVAVALIPATYQVALMTGNFAPGQDIIHLHLGWMAPRTTPLAFLWFWPLNFGLFLLLAPALWYQLLAWNLLDWTRVQQGEPPVPRSRETDAATAFVVPAGLVFFVALNVMFAKWEWDNTKLMLWCYLAFLPFLWRLWIRPLAWPLRVPLCGVLFFSGVVSLAGGLTAHQLNYKLIDRAELDGTRAAVAALPTDARFACAPDYNHPLVYCGRKLAMGYDGHLYSQGLKYGPLEHDLNALMLGQPGWEMVAAKLGVRYVFWGPNEAKRWPQSARPWATRPPVAAGLWGSIYKVGGR